MKSLILTILLCLPLLDGWGQTIKTVKPAGGGDYSSAQAAESDLDGSNFWWNVELHTGGNAGIVAIDGLTYAFSASEPCRWYSAQLHGGTPSTRGAFIVVPAASGAAGIGIAVEQEQHVWIDGLSLVTTNYNVNTTRVGIRDNGYANETLGQTRITNCLFFNHFSAVNNTSVDHCIYFKWDNGTSGNFGSSTANGKAWNNIMYGQNSTRSGTAILMDFRVQTGATGQQAARVDTWNSSAYDTMARGYRAYAARTSGAALGVTLTINETNSVSEDAGTDYLYTSLGTVGTVSVTRTYCASGDATADDFGGSGNLINVVATSIWGSATDLTPRDESVLVNAGATTAGSADGKGYPRRMGQNGLQDLGGLERPYRNRTQ